MVCNKNIKFYQLNPTSFGEQVAVKQYIYYTRNILVVQRVAVAVM